MTLNATQWLIALLCAFMVGLSKTGFSGVSIITVALFAMMMPARESTGAVLPLLIVADVVAVTAFRRHAVWSHLWRMFPWAAAGIVIGWATMRLIHDDNILKLMIGVILIVMVALQWAQRLRPLPTEQKPASHLYAAAMGLTAGFTTMTANAAGPVMLLYFLAVGLPKMEFIGTGAWYFCIMNWFKVPFSVQMGTINAHSLLFDLKLAPLVVIGALTGRWLIKFVDQKAFEALALAFALIGGAKLIFDGWPHF
ncbi:UPF0721 transmembrane protein [Capsulimonas corticalis]|uniref:Probable membrane transporter protein n=1 Tax=Capsulimonas corticalis TaxID=2219043 RepID=A0A402D0W1_9BACT|nr:sulfite exporter TauE/SafE family protein [Capsulimonas corticalis]BDI31750.1 UPF0721 transmembrane protein [Capsulimonas corticalis]